MTKKKKTQHIVTTEKLGPCFFFAEINGSNNYSVIKIVADKSPNQLLVAAFLFHPIPCYLSIYLLFNFFFVHLSLSPSQPV